MRKANKKKRPFRISQLLIHLILAVWAFTTIYPFYWVVINSFKEKKYILKDSFSFPAGKMFTLDNFSAAFERMDIGRAYFNSVGIAVIVTVCVVIIAGLAAYGLSRYRFHGRELLHTLVVASMMFPVFATIIPVFRMEYALHIVNTDSTILNWLSTALPQIAGNLAFGIVVLAGFIDSLPLDLEEAAYLDGCSIYGIFFKIVIPVCRPSFATVAIFTFLWSYNDLFTQMFFLRYDKFRTITLLLNQISSQAGTNYGLMCSAVVLVVVPVLIVYILLQNNIVKGLTVGALKG